MIRYALICADCEAEFEAWFPSSAAYDAQAEGGQLACPTCHGTQIAKQIMAPSVRTSRSRAKTDQPKPADLIEAARTHIANTHDYVGDAFPDEARAMHYGEIDDRPIWGDVSPEESKALSEEGVKAAPLPPALVPPKPKDKSGLN